ncbi:MAG: hypothetical protein ACE1ZH_04470 [Gammaproteobacteria bacterium]
MPKKRFTPEQIVNYLRSTEIEIAKVRTVPDFCKDIGIVEQTYLDFGYGLQLKKTNNC